MKKFESLGRSLSKMEQKKIKGGDYGGGETGCSTTYSGCSYMNDGETLTCDYVVQCPNRPPRYLCGFQCSAGDGGDCLEA